MRFLFCLLCLFCARPLWAQGQPAQGQPAQGSSAQGQSFSTIREVRVNPLSNGVQITVLSDGILQNRDADTNGQRMRIFFPQARNGTGKNFFNVNRYPVSYLQLSTPRGAVGGIGVQMDIQNFVSTSATLAPTPDGQGVLLTIQSNRTLATRGTGAGASASGAGASTEGNGEGASPAGGAGQVDISTRVEYIGGKLNLRAVKADIHPLLALIAQKSGLAITVDDAIGRDGPRTVSLNLIGVEPEAALRAIANVYGLSFANINGIYMFSEGQPSDLATYRLSATASFRLQNTQAQTASELLPNFLYSYVKTNAQQNAVVVTAPTQVLEKIRADLRQVDVPSPLISIEAIAVEFTDSNDLDIGLNLGSPNRTSFASLDVGSGSFNYSTIGALPRNFEINLRALEARGRARVRARPQMAVVNGRTANIFVGAQRFIQTQFNQFGQTQTRIQPVDVGVKLSVTPLTGGNGEITTRVSPEVSNITELDLATGLPVLSSRRAETTVRVKDGETIAIGGLSLDQEQTTRGRIPILGSLPIIGGLFRTRGRNTVRTELIVFVTPRILNVQAPVNPQAPAQGQANPQAPSPANPQAPGNAQPNGAQAPAQGQAPSTATPAPAR